MMYRRKYFLHQFHNEDFLFCVSCVIQKTVDNSVSFIGTLFIKLVNLGQDRLKISFFKRYINRYALKNGFFKL